MIAYEPPPPPSEEVEEEVPPPLPAGGRRSARKVTEMGERADLWASRGQLTAESERGGERGRARERALEDGGALGQSADHRRGRVEGQDERPRHTLKGGSGKEDEAFLIYQREEPARGAPFFENLYV